MATRRRRAGRPGHLERHLDGTRHVNWWELVIAFVTCDLVTGLVVGWVTLRLMQKGTPRA